MKIPESIIQYLESHPGFQHKGDIVKAVADDTAHMQETVGRACRKLAETKKIYRKVNEKNEATYKSRREPTAEDISNMKKVYQLFYKTESIDGSWKTNNIALNEIFHRIYGSPRGFLVFLKIAKKYQETQSGEYWKGVPSLGQLDANKEKMISWYKDLQALQNKKKNFTATYNPETKSTRVEVHEDKQSGSMGL